MSSFSAASQAWVFPPAGAVLPPGNVSAAFGPIHNGDTIEFMRAPADQKPTLFMWHRINGGALLLCPARVAAY